MVSLVLTWPAQAPIVYCATREDVERVCGHLAALAASRKRLVIAFDMEWAFAPAEKPPALIQLCLRTSPELPPLLLAPPQPATQEHGQAAQESEEQRRPPKRARPSSAPGQQEEQGGPAPAQQQNQQEQQQQQQGVVCYLLHLARLGATAAARAPPALKQLLEHDKVFLVTAGDRDEEKLQQDLGIHPRHLEQINMMHFLLRAEEGPMGRRAEPPHHQQQQRGKRRGKRRQEEGGAEGAPAAGSGPPGRQRAEVISLASMVGLYLGMRLDKAMQLANDAWEAEELDARARAYAAADAYAHLLVFEEIKSRLRAAAAGKGEGEGVAASS